MYRTTEILAVIPNTELSKEISDPNNSRTPIKHRAVEVNIFTGAELVFLST